MDSRQQAIAFNFADLELAQGQQSLKTIRNVGQTMYSKANKNREPTYVWYSRTIACAGDHALYNIGVILGGTGPHQPMDIPVMGGVLTGLLLFHLLSEAFD